MRPKQNPPENPPENLSNWPDSIADLSNMKAFFDKSGAAKNPMPDTWPLNPETITDAEVVKYFAQNTRQSVQDLFDKHYEEIDQEALVESTKVDGVTESLSLGDLRILEANNPALLATFDEAKRGLSLSYLKANYQDEIAVAFQQARKQNWEPLTQLCETIATDRDQMMQNMKSPYRA